MPTLRRVLASLAVAGAVLTSAVAIQAAPAYAACSPSYKPFRDYTSARAYYNTKHHLLSIYHYYAGVAVYCGSSKVATVLVTEDTATAYKVWVEDSSCDNIGPYWHAWAPGGDQYAYGAGGCGNAVPYSVNRNSIEPVMMWWVQFGGTNSPTYDFP